MTLRLAAPPLERFGGRELIDALRAVGLEHGKFSIFHKLAPSGATLMSVASLVEPGTFDLDRIEAQRFPGISLFARDAEGSVFHTYSTYGRGVEAMIGAYRLIDLAPKGRDEDGLPYSMAWVRHHDRYEDAATAASSCCGGNR